MNLTRKESGIFQFNSGVTKFPSYQVDSEAAFSLCYKQMRMHIYLLHIFDCAHSVLMC